eukprot:15478152-Alexandrium_andersonii.AAC.1
MHRQSPKQAVIVSSEGYKGIRVQACKYRRTVVPFHRGQTLFGRGGGAQAKQRRHKVMDACLWVWNCKCGGEPNILETMQELARPTLMSEGGLKQGWEVLRVRSEQVDIS